MKQFWGYRDREPSYATLQRLLVPRSSFHIRSNTWKVAVTPFIVVSSICMNHIVAASCQECQRTRSNFNAPRSKSGPGCLLGESLSVPFVIKRSISSGLTSLRLPDSTGQAILFRKNKFSSFAGQLESLARFWSSSQRWRYSFQSSCQRF